MGLVAPLLITRWRFFPIVAAIVGAVLITSAVNVTRLWLDYLLLFTNLPYFMMHKVLSYSLFGIETLACAAFCVRVASASCPPVRSPEA